MKEWLYRSPFWRPILQKGMWTLPPSCIRRNEVLLSFDDGPTESTALIDELLVAQGARALFFLRGDRLPADPEEPLSRDETTALRVTKDLQSHGHLIGCHGLHHRRLGLLPLPPVRRELALAKARIRVISGFDPPCFRPPYGNWAPWLGKLPGNMGMQCMFWSLNPMDYSATSSEQILDRTLPFVRAGDIILLHCSGTGEAHTRAALPELIDGIRLRGFRIADPLGLLEALDG